MGTKRFGLGMLLLILILPVLSLGQSFQIKPGFSFEVLNQKIGWDDSASSRLKSYIFSTDTEITLQNGLSGHIFLGYSLSNFDGLIFRQLPFSIELGVKEISGLFAGVEIDKKIFSVSDYELDLLGQFVSYYGFENKWDMPDLNVDGTVLGNPSWSRFEAGPVVSYSGLSGVFPFFGVEFSKLWGTFTIDQDIQDLSGREEKKISGKNFVTFVAGSEFEVTPDFYVKGALYAMPFKGGVDLRGILSIHYVFQTPNRRNP